MPGNTHTYTPKFTHHDISVLSCYSHINHKSYKNNECVTQTRDERTKKMYISSMELDLVGLDNET